MELFTGLNSVEGLEYVLILPAAVTAIVVLPGYTLFALSRAVGMAAASLLA